MIKTQNATLMCCAGIVLGLAGLPSTSANAQDALGAGNVLDSNLGLNSGGQNAPTRQGGLTQQDLRIRNSIVTGDVVGGRGFRGSVGYSAPRDFRGSLGSNDLFNFRADSALSNPQLFSLGTTYEQLRYGQDIGVLRYERSGIGATPASISPMEPQTGLNFNRVDFGRIDSTQLRMDRTTLASSQAFTLAASPQPRIVGITYNEENQPLTFNVSTVRGLTLEPLAQNVSTIGLSSLDAARVRQDVSGGGFKPNLGAFFETSFERLYRKDERIDSTAKGLSVDPSLQPDYARILQSVADRYAGRREGDLTVSPELLNQLGSEYQSLRTQLASREPSRSGITSVPAAGSPNGLIRDESITPEQETPLRGPGQSALPPSATGTMVGSGGIVQVPDATAAGGVPGADERPPDGQGTTPPVVPPPTRQIPLPPGADTPEGESGVRQPPRAEDFAIVLRHGERVEKLSGENEDRFNELLASAEQKLREGDYFVAERRFERALRFTPGHPMATVGAAHAQLGAGLYLSASLSLRNLLLNQPEMIDVTYSPDLLPKRQRLDEAVKKVREMLGKPSADRLGYAFLLAYIGKQTNDRGLIGEGLDAMAQAEGAEGSSQFVALLRKIWLAEASDQSGESGVRDAPAPPAEPQK